MRNIKDFIHGSCLTAAPPQCNNLLHRTQLKRSSQIWDPVWLLSASLVKNIFVLVWVIYKIVVYYIVFLHSPEICDELFWCCSENNYFFFFLNNLLTQLQKKKKKDCNCVCQKGLELELSFKCFSNARENLGASFGALISVQTTRCIINSCNTTRREITKHHPCLKPLPKSKCCSRPLKLGASRSGSLLVRSFKSHSFSHTMKQSDSF